ncbi:MAG: hypothetical protein OHK0036_05110 [Bacteroidia bacterium]
MLKNIIREWYVLNKTQRRGVLVVLVIFLFSILFKWFYQPTPPDKETIYFANIILQNKEDSVTRSSIISTSKDSLFFFNPNYISESEMRMLGLSEKIIKNIVHYRNAGGKFYTKESLKKIYGVNDSIYNRLAPYILIEITEKKSPNFKENENKNTLKFSKKSIELNTADTLELEQLKGIGKVLSARIIKYRNRLGGFYSIEQLKEVYGINDDAYKMITQQNEIKIDIQLIRKINLKTADFKTMIRHPYFNKDIVVKILQMQRNNENFNEEKLNSVFGEDFFEKIKPYIQW